MRGLYARRRWCRSTAWSPHDAGRVLSVDEEALCTWAVDHGGALSSSGRTAQTDELSHKLAGGLWDPHDAQGAASWAGTGVAVWDLRTHARSGGIAHAHETPVRHADYNPQRPHQLASAGDDGRVKVRWRG
jgi:WD40 repeat protein